MKKKGNIEINQKEYFYKMLPGSESGRLAYIPTVTNLLHFASREYSSRPALADGETIYTYAELDSRCAIRRGFLKNAGLGLGDRIAIYSPRSTDVYEVFLSAAANGCISVIIPPETDEAELEKICKKFCINAVICDKSLEAAVIAAGCRYYFTDFSLCGHYSAPAYEAIKDSVCAICLEDNLKGAVLTHGAVMRGAFNGCFVPGGAMFRKYFSFFPPSDVRGFIRSFLSSLYTGGLLFTSDSGDCDISPDFSPDTLILDNLRAEKLLNENNKINNIKTFILADKKPAGAELIKKTEKLGIRTMQSFSIPECGGIVAGSQDTVLKTGSAGFIYPDILYKITDGELRLSGDALMLGYYSDIAASTAAFDKEGWFRTGIRAYKDADGFLYFTDMKEDNLPADKNADISAEEIEKVFLRSDYIKDCRIKEEAAGGRNIFAVEILPEEKFIRELSENESKDLFRNTVKGINKTLPENKQIKKIIIRTDNIHKNAHKQYD